MLIDDRGVVSAAVGVHPANDNPGAFRHPDPAFPSLLERGHAPAGRADRPVMGLGQASSYEVTPSRPVACTTTTGPAASRQIPQMTPAGQPTSESDPPPNPGPSSPNEPGGIFTANLKDQELANCTADTVAEVADHA